MLRSGPVARSRSFGCRSSARHEVHGRQSERGGVLRLVQCSLGARRVGRQTERLDQRGQGLVRHVLRTP